MRKVYNSNMIDMNSSYDNHIEIFGLGLLSSWDKAEETARRYLINLIKVKGFKDYNIA